MTANQYKIMKHGYIGDMEIDHQNVSQIMFKQKITQRKLLTSDNCEKYNEKEMKISSKNLG